MRVCAANEALTLPHAVHLAGSRAARVKYAARCTQLRTAAALRALPRAPCALQCGDRVCRAGHAR